MTSSSERVILECVFIVALMVIEWEYTLMDLLNRFKISKNLDFFPQTNLHSRSTEGFTSSTRIGGGGPMSIFTKKVYFLFRECIFCFRPVYFVFNTSRWVGMEVDDHTLSEKQIWKKNIHDKKRFFNKNIFSKISKIWIFEIFIFSKFLIFPKKFPKNQEIFDFSRFFIWKLVFIMKFDYFSSRFPPSKDMVIYSLTVAWSLELATGRRPSEQCFYGDVCADGTKLSSLDQNTHQHHKHGSITFRFSHSTTHHDHRLPTHHHQRLSHRCYQGWQKLWPLLLATAR